MLEELLKYDQLGSKDELLFILFDALPISNNQKKGELKKFCISNSFSIPKSFNGIIKLLEFISFIRIIDDKIVLNKNLFNPNKFKNKENYFIESDFVKRLLNALKIENSIDILFNTDALKYNVDEDKYYIKNNLIPYKFFAVRNLLLNIGFIKWGIDLNSNHLIVNQHHNQMFGIVIDWLINIQNGSRYRKSIDQLKADLKKREEVGKAAELFVLQFEYHRLNRHPRTSAIKRISEDFVNAGYDIESFNEIDSIIIDRFIEVKSFVGEVSFFWTKTEVKIADEFGDKYFLYLVDRNLMKDRDYVPKIFQNPHEKIFENEFWKKETECWKITLEN